METMQLNGRTAARVLTAMKTREGAGFLVNRPFPSSALDDFDPFLLLDEMGPMELGPNEAKGAPDHPHRGFETVT
jgi:redox-sensitive bicupin YhaK (pirin superfamily)